MIAVLLYGIATRWTANVLPDGYTAQALGGRLRGRALPHRRAAQPRARGRDRNRDRHPAGRARPPIGSACATRASGPCIELLAAIPFAVPFVVIAFGLLHDQRHLRRPVAAGDAVAAGAGPCRDRLLLRLLVGRRLDGGRQRGGLSEAARTCGASLGATIFRVILPNIGPGMASGAILAFGVSFNEIAMVQILAGDRFETVPLYTLNLLKSTDADFNVLAVMTTVSFAITLGSSTSIAVVYFNAQAPRRTPRPGAAAVGGAEQSRDSRAHEHHQHRGHHVSKRFGDKLALDDVSLDVKSGETDRAAGLLRLRQDHAAARHRGPQPAERRAHPVRRSRHDPPADPPAAYRHGVPELFAVPQHDGAGEHRLPARGAGPGPEGDRAARRRAAGPHRARPPMGGPPFRQLVRRAAAAHGAGPRAGARPRRAAARRAALGPRRRGAAAPARRDPPHPAEHQDHRTPRDARPVRGAGRRRPRRRDARGAASSRSRPRPSSTTTPTTEFSARFIGNRNTLDLPVRDGRIRLCGSRWRSAKPVDDAARARLPAARGRAPVPTRRTGQPRPDRDPHLPGADDALLPR